jgi:UDP-N-acetylmuramate dehydrogenase
VHLEENKPLAPLTTLGVGGPARWFVHAGSESDIAEAAEWARAKSTELFVLGGGSNLLVADAGFDGLVVQIGLRGTEKDRSAAPSEKRILRAAAGENWDQLVEYAVENDYAGIECLAGVPGTVGGTPVQNVGAYGQEVADVIVRVRAYDLLAHSFVELEAEECSFTYRRSRFNAEDRGRFVVTRVDYLLEKGGVPALRYAELQQAFPEGTKPSLREVAAKVRRIRQSKGMLLVEGDLDCRSAGSFFKNPVVTEEQASEIALAAGNEPPRFRAGNHTTNAGLVKVPAAWLIEHAGFNKGFARGAAAISSRHTLALVNRGGATACELMELAEEIQRAVELRFGVSLAMEPVLLGFAEDTASAGG